MVGSGWEGRPRGTPLQEMVLRSYLASPSSLVSWAFFGDALYWKPARSATMLRTVLEAPRGLYSPRSHSLMVCWRVPNSLAIWSWVRDRCLRRARTSSLSHSALFRLSFITCWHQSVSGCFPELETSKSFRLPHLLKKWRKFLRLSWSRSSSPRLAHWRCSWRRRGRSPLARIR